MKTSTYLSQMPVDLGLKAAVGATIGFLSNTNPIHWSVVLTIQSLANFVLYQYAVEFDQKQRCDKRTIEAVTNAVTYGASILTLRFLDLIALRTAGMLGAVTLGFMLSRIKWINEYPLPKTPPVQGEAV